MRWIRIAAFHIRQFVKVPYFIQLMVISTMSTVIVQFLAWQAWSVIRPEQAWIRAGIIGLWTTCTAAAGIIGFERFKGTLVHLVLAPIGSLRASVGVVCAASIFGLDAFPLSWMIWALLSQTVSFDFATWSRFWQVMAGIILLWLGSVAMSLVVSALFFLTPNAITYEGLLLTPIFVFSGVMFTTTAIPWPIYVLSHIFPLSWPIDLLFGRANSLDFVHFILWCLCFIGWMFIAWGAGRFALSKATRAGTLEVV